MTTPKSELILLILFRSCTNGFASCTVHEVEAVTRESQRTALIGRHTGPARPVVLLSILWGTIATNRKIYPIVNIRPSDLLIYPDDLERIFNVKY